MAEEIDPTLAGFDDDIFSQEEQMSDIEGKSLLETDEEFVPEGNSNKDPGYDNSYYRVAKRHKLLEHQEVLELARRWRTLGDNEARKTIVSNNLRLSMKIATHYIGRGLDYDDLVQEGNIGIMMAVDRFDPEKGCRFSTYATWWIKQCMVRAIMNFKDTIRIPVHAKESQNKIYKVTDELRRELQREPTLEEVAARAELEIDEVKKTIRQSRINVVSLEELAYSGSPKEERAVTIGDHTADIYFPSAVTAIEAKERLEEASIVVRALVATIKTLPISEKSKTAFRMYYGLDGHSEGATLKSVANTPRFGVSSERIRQIIVEVWKNIEESGIAMDDEKLVATIDLIHNLENIVGSEAYLSPLTETMELDKVTPVPDNANNGAGELAPAEITAMVTKLGADLKTKGGVEVDKEQFIQATEPIYKNISPIVDQVLTLTGQAFDIEKASLFAKSCTRPDEKEKNRTRAKCLAMYALRSDFNVQSQELAHIFGFSNYTRVSILNSKTLEELRTDSELQAKLSLIRSQYSLAVYGGNFAQLKRCQKTLFPRQVEEMNGIVEKTVTSFNQKIRCLHDKLETLDVSDRYKEIFRSRFDGNPNKEPMTCDALGQTFGVSRARVYQILESTIKALAPILEPSDTDLMENYTQELAKVRLVVELQNL